MAKRKKANLEYRHYELSQEFPVLALWGDKWILKYEKMNCLHFHNHLEIGYCNWGEGDLYLENDIHRFNSGMVTFIPKNIPHSTDSDTGTVSSWEYVFIDLENIFDYDEVVEKNGHTKWFDIISNISKKAIMLDEKEHLEIARIIKDILQELKKNKGRYKTKVRALLAILFIEIERIFEENIVDSEKGKVNMQIMPALEYIRYNYVNDIKISTLAEACSLSETHFRRVFQSIMNISPLDYINEVRIHASCNLLRTTDDSIESIAIRNGYSTITTYNRNFRKIMGTTPLKWRNLEENKGKNLNNYSIRKLDGWM